MRILFVCLGNICRSPTAEGVMRHLVAEAGREDQFEIESAGTAAWHVGKSPDPRTVEVAAARQIDLASIAQQATPEDFNRFDLIVAMDRSNREDLLALRALAAEADGQEPNIAAEASRPEPHSAAEAGGRESQLAEVGGQESQLAEVHLLRDYADGPDLEVPDPYYGESDGFAEVLEIVERNCAALLGSCVD